MRRKNQVPLSFCLLAGLLAGLPLLGGCVGRDTSLVTQGGAYPIDETLAAYYAAGERVFLVVWHDLSRDLGPDGEGEGSLGFSSSLETDIEGDYRRSDGQSFDYTCHTTDGRSGTVTIDNKGYDLAAGNVFLVARRADGLHVTQLARNLVLTGTPEDLLTELARTDPEIRAFVKGGA